MTTKAEQFSHLDNIPFTYLSSLNIDHKEAMHKQPIDKITQGAKINILQHSVEYYLVFYSYIYIIRSKKSSLSNKVAFYEDL